ncbi:hypothetical protein GCK32_002624, partial [Trichostrongylus colubriformis]
MSVEIRAELPVTKLTRLVESNGRTGTPSQPHRSLEPEKMSLTTKLRRIRKPPPEGWDLIEPTLEEFEAKMREAETDPHEGKRRTETLWPIFRIHHQRTRYIYDLFYKREAISRELYEFCLAAKIADAQLIAKWKKQGYENLCCLSRRSWEMENDFFPPFRNSEAFPQLCDGVCLKNDSEKGLHIVATRDIPCGEAVCVDTGKVVNLEDGLCCYCLSELSEKHGNRLSLLQNLGMFRLAVHLALSYTSKEILACLAIGQVHRDTCDITAMKSDSLAAALSLQIDAYPVDLSSTDGLVGDIAKRLDEHPQWGMIPEVYRLEAFKTLLRLISSRLMTNAHSIYFVDRLERGTGGTHPDGSMPSGVGLFPIASWFNHSCRANINSFFHGNKLVFVSAGIRKGEEDFLAGRGFTCHCSVCVTNDSIDDLLESVAEHSDLILNSFSTVEDYKRHRKWLPDGHRSIESIAQMCVESAGQEDPEHRLFFYGEILECQRRRGLHFSPDQIRTHLNCALAYYDIMSKSAEKKQKHDSIMQVHLFAALVRMRTFYGKLYPAYNIAKVRHNSIFHLQTTRGRIHIKQCFT